MENHNSRIPDESDWRAAPYFFGRSRVATRTRLPLRARQRHHRVAGRLPRRGWPLASRQASWIVYGGPEPAAAPGANCWRRSSAHARRPRDRHPELTSRQPRFSPEPLRASDSALAARGVPPPRHAAAIDLPSPSARRPSTATVAQAFAASRRAGPCRPLRSLPHHAAHGAHCPRYVSGAERRGRLLTCGTV